MDLQKHMQKLADAVNGAAMLAVLSGRHSTGRAARRGAGGGWLHAIAVVLGASGDARTAATVC